MLQTFNTKSHQDFLLEIGCEEIADPERIPLESRDVFGLTQWYTGALEKVIRKAPDQYWWAHRRWKKRRMRRRRTAA